MKSSQLAFPESCNEQHARSLARRLIQGWRDRSEPSATHALQQYPFLSRYRSIAMDLAYEEYCLRSESGELVDADNFCRQFPELLSLHQRIAMHLLLEEEQTAMQQENPPDWPEAGQQIMGYRVCEEIGRGSFARVYTATEEDLGGRLVVIKVCPHGADEADTLGRIAHPAIVPVHSVKQDVAGLTVICMPMLGTGTLSQVIQQGTVEHAGQDPRASRDHSQRIVQWMLPIARALDHAHRLGVLHLDLKPSNILVTDDERPMLLDFNLSWDSAHDFHRTGGTLPYMSPEQIGQLVVAPDRELLLDQRSDIFSFGVILFELLHGRLPWLIDLERETIHDLAALLLQRQREFSHQYFPSTSGTLKDVIRGCLAWDPQDRYQEMGEVVAALERFSCFLLCPERTMNIRRRQLLTMTLASAGFLVGLRLATNSPGAKKLIRQGQAALNHGYYDRAEILFTDAMQFPESSSEAQYRRGLARALKGDSYWAIDDFFAVREKMPDPRLDALVGYSYQLLRRYSEALTWYRFAIGSGFSHRQLWINMGHVAMNQNLPGEARRYLDRAEKAGADGPEYFYARLLSESWKHDLSERSARQLAYWAGRLARCQFTGPDAHANLARALVRPGEISAAGVAMATSHLKTAIYQGADVRELARDPQLRDLFKHDPLLFQTETTLHQGSCPEPIPDLYNTIHIGAEEFQVNREK